MARIRSPNYPAISLIDAIARIGQLFERERQHWATKEVAIKGMGYGSVNGASLSAISAAEKYGLIERDKNKYRVTARAIAILHPHSQAEKLDALAEAIRAPALFAELLKEFEFPLPSDDNLKAYLVRRGFSDISLPSVIKAFRDTIALVSPESGTPEVAPAAKPAAQKEPSMQSSMVSHHARALSHLVGGGTVSASAEVFSASPLIVSFNGRQVEVSAKLATGEAVDQLIRVLQANKPLLPEKPPNVNVSETQEKAD